MKKIILASGSAQRKRLLAQITPSFEVIPAEVDETLPAHLPPRDGAAAVARRKAETAAAIAAGRGVQGIVIGADTIVVAGSGKPRIIGKPEDDAHATAILKRLSGSRHSVVTGLCVLDIASGRAEVGWDETHIVMYAMTDKQIGEYVASGEARGKAGAYGFREDGDPYVKQVEGSFSNVLGLPIELLREFLKRLDVEIG